MLHENEDKEMKAPGICCGGSSCRHMFASSVRVKEPGSGVRLSRWLHIELLVVLLAGQASCNLISAAPTSSQTSGVHYFVSVTVDVTGEKKDQSEITAWLTKVFQNDLNCVFPNLEETTTTPSSPTTTNETTATTLQSYNTTTAATSTRLNNYTTTTATTSTTTLKGNITTIVTTNQITIAAPEQNNITTASIPDSGVITVTLGNGQTKPSKKPNPNQSNKLRIARQISGSMAQTSGISNDTTTHLFQGIEVSCTKKTAIIHTTCSVTLKLKQSVPPCCILRTLCAASRASSDIHVVGQNAARTGPLQTECSSNPQEENSCTYTGQNGASCEESATAYRFTQINSTHCADEHNSTCSCSAYCSGTDAYYTFDVSIQDPTISLPYLLSLISSLRNPPLCSPRPGVPCPSPNVAAELKEFTVTWGSTVTRGILVFTHEIPICDVLAGLMNVFRSEKQIYYNNKVTQAAYCGNSDNPLASQSTWMDVDLKPANFCAAMEESTTVNCQNGKITFMELDKHCALVPFTTLGPNVTTAQPNTTTSPVNVTAAQPNTTTSSVNVTTAQPNTTTLSVNVTTAQPNTTTLSVNVTTAQANTTTLSVNVTAAQPNTTTLSVNVTAAQPNTTTLSVNVTTAQPNTTTLSVNVTTAQPNTTTSSVNVTIAQPNTTTSSVNVTSSPLNTTAEALNATTAAGDVTATTTLNTTATTTSGSVPGTTESEAVSQAKALLELTKDVSNLTSSQVDQLVSQLENLLSGPTVSLALGDTSVQIVSNLLDASPETLSDSSKRIIGIVDTVALKLVLSGKPETLLSTSVALSVKPADGSNFQETFFSISDPSNVQVRGDPRHRRRGRADSSIPQGSIRLPPSITENLPFEEQRLASRVQFNFYQKSTVFQDRSLGERKLNSGILGASVANLTISELQDDVVIHLRHTEPIPGNFVTTCVFWDFTRNNGSGGWNPKGCNVQSSTDNDTVCGCNHLTSFAVLLDLSRKPLTSRLQATILTFITYIGCGISAIFLSITLLTYLAFGKLRKDIPSKILIQLCLALLLLNLVFLVDSWLALYPEAVGLCISTAWFLHYFLLVAFTWMGLEAVHMYLALVKVFNSYISRYMVKFSLVGWGVPMIVVIIVIAIDVDNYGLVSYGKFSDGTNDEFCWLKNDIAFYVAVVAYFCVIFAFNLIMFIVVLVQLCRIKRQNPHNVLHRNTLQDVRSVAGITILLGLTWGFAFFAWGPVNLPFMYLFAIFNSLQGFFIFVFHCAVKENVRRQWRTYLCCGRMRLAENSEWSRTATQKTTKKSSVTRLTSLHSSKSSQSNNSTSSSTFLVSDSSEQINGIGSPFEDRAIIADEGPSMDVILNEINSQYRNQ